MAKKIRVQNLSLDPLLPHNIPKKFDCGDADLNEFIKKDALNHQLEGVATTTLVLYNQEVVAFFSLAADCITLDPEEKKYLKKYSIPYPEFPAIKICRMAVDRRHQGRGIGEIILRFVIGWVETLRPKLGIRFVSVDAYPAAVKFYEKHKFLRNLSGEEKSRKTVSMRYDIKPIVPVEDFFKRP